MARERSRTTVQRQTAVTAYLKSKQLLLFAFAGQNNRLGLLFREKTGKKTLVVVITHSMHTVLSSHAWTREAFWITNHAAISAAKSFLSAFFLIVGYDWFSNSKCPSSLAALFSSTLSWASNPMPLWKRFLLLNWYVEIVFLAWLCHGAFGRVD